MALRDTEQVRLNTYHLWGHWRVGDYLNKGSFGRVYDLHDAVGIEPICALKVITIEYTEEAKQNGEDREKFLLEGLRSTLDEIHQMMEFKGLRNFVTIYGYEDYPIRENGELIGYDVLIRMEKLKDLPSYIEDRRRNDNPLTEKELIQIGMDICVGLQDANQYVRQRHHNGEFIHRDIKPNNIFVSEGNVYKLGDLGIATIDGWTQYTKIGTPFYMAPEMFAGKGYHANVDLFALGRTLEKLTEGIELKSDLQNVIDKAEEYIAERRYSSARAMLEDLRKCANQLEGTDYFNHGTRPIERKTVKVGRDSPTEKITEPLTQKVSDDVQRTSNAKNQTSKIPIFAGIAAIAVVICLVLFGVQRIADNKAIQEKQLEYDKAFELAQSYINQSEYANAIETLDSIGGDYEKYNDAQELRDTAVDKYKNTEFGKVDQQCKDQDYAAAASILSAMKDVIGDDEDITDKEVDVRKARIQYTVDGYKNANDFAGAILYLNDNAEVVSADTELTELLDTCKQKYRDGIFASAEKSYDNDGYQAAVDTINEGLKVLNQDEKMMEKKEYYLSLKPVKLTDYEIFSAANEYDISIDEDTIDRFKNEYTSSFSVSEEGDVTFLLDNQYSKFTGIISCPEGCRPKDNLSNVKVTIRGDDKILFTSKEAGPEMKPQEFSIDVLDVEMLTISWKCLPAMNIWNNWCVYGTIFDGYLYP